MCNRQSHAEAKQPEDWDEEEDGVWEPPRIANPACKDAPGCGGWKRPTKPNPDYKGKWSAPMIDNPAYKVGCDISRTAVWQVDANVAVAC